MIKFVGMAAAVALPLFNIPLMLKIEKRRSSQDISLSWVVGVWVCLVLMLPSGLASTDPVYRVFTVVNITLFSGVLVQVLRFR